MTSPLIRVFQDIMMLMKDFGKLGEWVLSLFNLPTTIRIGNYMVSTGGLFSAILTMISFLVLAQVLKDYMRYLAIGAGIIFALSILSSILNV